jgi:uncharacterized protein (DUF362 family)/NAD-dependent dihydropyrimidine dehydrogenase PreA subunit
MNGRAKVAVAPCRSYFDGLAEALRVLVDSLGGMSAFVGRGQAVLIKPNLLTGRQPDQAVTTHPEVVRHLIRMVKEAGATPSVADSPANVEKLETVWQKTGMEAVCSEEGVRLLNLEKAGSVQFTANGFTFSVAKPVIEADAVVNVPKVKTHMLTVLTGAVKNLYGTIPGFQKTNLHRNHPRAEEFGDLLAVLHGKVRPALSVADGIVGMGGAGPSAGDIVPLGFLAASADAAALDVILCRILKIDPDSVPYLRSLRADPSCVTDPGDIEVIGPAPESLRPAAFKVPGTVLVKMIPRWLVKLLAPALWIRPSFSDKCIACGQCVRACPAGALAKDGDGRPALNTEKCIGCCCCMEVCPAQAVRMVQSPLLTFFRGGKGPV